MASFVYIDETGTNNLDDLTQPRLSLTGVIVREDQVRPLTDSIREIIGTHLFNARGKELHGYEIFHGEGEWKGIDPPTRIEAYRDALRLLERHEIVVAHATIDKANLKAKYPGRAISPYLLALQFLCEKVDAFDPTTLKVLVADEAKEQRTRAVQMVGDLQYMEFGAVQGSTLATIIDSLHYVRSHESAGVQMADLVAFIRQRRRQSPEKDARTETVMDELMELVNSAVKTFRNPWP